GVGLFAFAKAASPTIRAMGGEASVCVLTRQNSPAWAAASGVAKALAKEWPKARIRTVRLLDDIEDLAPRMVLKVATWGPSAHDLQLVRDGVIRQVLVKQPINQDIVGARRRHPRLTKNSVILLVGGAVGITAEASVMLAREYHAHIVATGRTPMPEQYPYQGINDDASLKRILFDELNRTEHGDVAASVREEHKRIRRQREIWTTRERVERAGGKFSYYQVDVTQHVALADTLAKIREECGPIHGVIHGAGIIDDSLLEKKTVEEFKAVYYTKAISVFNLALGLWHDPLRFVFMFSSLASFAGTPGQTDYVAANEVINAMAKFWNARVRYPVRSLLWSVWTETGLIASSAAQRQMARLGLAGISNEQGVKLLHDELVAGPKFDDWVLLTPQSTLEYTTRGQATALQQTHRLGT
ncbi:MAG: SDR family NAD(P)-dependent oxidoreductase, partial [Betaproteobacteria bacterium]